MSRLLVVNSKDRTNGTSMDFNVNMKQYMRNFNGQVPSQIKLVGCQFSNCIYNVNSHNNTFTFFETTGTSNATATVTPGIYTGSTLLTALTAAMTSASGVSNSYSGTYSSSTLKYTIVASLHSFSFVVDSPLIGFYASQSSSLNLTGLYPAKLLTDYIVVQTNVASTFVSSFANFGSFMIPLADCPTGTSFFLGKNQLPEIVGDLSPNINMSFTVSDPNGNLVDNNNFDIIFSFEIC